MKRTKGLMFIHVIIHLINHISAASTFIQGRLWSIINKLKLNY